MTNKKKDLRAKAEDCRNHNIGRALRDARKIPDYTQDEAAQILARKFPSRWANANAQRISHYESGRRFPSASSMEDICEIYGLAVWKLWQSSSTKLEDQQSEIFDSEWLRLGKDIPQPLRTHLMGLMQSHLSAIEEAEKKHPDRKKKK